MHLTHHHGLGNDFLIAFVEKVPSDGPALARWLCDRRSGLGDLDKGADGLIFGTSSQEGHPVFTLFNSDGSKAAVSGNGLRCFGQALARRDGIVNLDVVVETGAGPRRVVVDGHPDAIEVRATVEMGAPGPGPLFDGLDLGLVGVDVLNILSVDLGNPHLVLLVDAIDTVDLGVIGPSVEAHFSPVGCNIHLMTVVDRSIVRLRPWERGVGLTEACGTGACAAAYAANQWGLVDSTVEVQMSGGSATVVVGDPIRLTGPAIWSTDLSMDYDESDGGVAVDE
ncbi:MAG: diaminopimelate epimerase [Acidimicrobiales bacterium]|nr:diaminopimelate epimerase [Acidimicrobiales bacterium]